MTTIALHTQGCKLNQAETEALARELWATGYQVVPPAQPADAYILNTCTVTATADAKARHWLRRAARLHPEALVVATGCYAQRQPEALSCLPGVGLVAGQEEKPHLVELLRERGLRPRGEPTPPPPRRTRALVKLQDGCSMGCRYCIVPSVRGKGHSRPPTQVMAEVGQRAAEGYQEVVLTGTHIGSYRWNGTDLPGLLSQVLAATAVPRLRLTSLLPADLTPRLLSLWPASQRRLCPHLHLPLQSGSSAVLEAMGRPYTPASYQRAVALARDTVPGMTITTDVMVGFPGEGEAEFEESLAFCREVGFARMHIFPYSPRPGTPAATLPQVNSPMVSRRTRRLLAEAARAARRFEVSQVGQVVPVLWEQEVAPGVWSGLAPGYLRAFTHSQQPLAGVIAPARLERPAPEGLWARLV